MSEKETANLNTIEHIIDIPSLNYSPIKQYTSDVKRNENHIQLIENVSPFRVVRGNLISKIFYITSLPYNSEYNTEKQIEYYLTIKYGTMLRYFLYHKFIDNQLIYRSTLSSTRSNSIVKNIYYTIENIEKLKNGKIKKYSISTQLELEILHDYLKNSNILHTILISDINLKCISHNVLYEEYKKNFSYYKTYYNQNGIDYENNKILNTSKLYINVYKGFVNLVSYYKEKAYRLKNVEKPKFGVYLYSRYPYSNN